MMRVSGIWDIWLMPCIWGDAVDEYQSIFLCKILFVLLAAEQQSRLTALKVAK